MLLSSIVLVHKYLQVAMEESEIKILHLEPGHLDWVTRMSLGLLNAGSNFCCLMITCLSDQQFVTLLLYFNGICIFAPDTDAMIDCIECYLSSLKKST